MLSRFLDLIRAELFLLTRRTATWVLMATWTLLGLMFAYIVPYVMYRNGDDEGPGTIPSMLPDQLTATLLDGYPFFGGAIALVLGVLAVGSEFGWDTFKTLFTQRPGRGQIFAAKMIALGIVIVPFVVVQFAAGAATGVVIGLLEDVAISAPSATSVIQGIMAGWMVLAAWAAVGVLLAVATRGTSLAIGIGILYSLVIEGLVSALAGSIGVVEPIVDFFLRANAYSLVRPLGGASSITGDSAATDGPGAFSGPFVDETQAALVLVAYMVVLLGASVWMLRRRDVD